MGFGIGRGLEVGGGGVCLFCLFVFCSVATVIPRNRHHHAEFQENSFVTKG